MAARKRYLLGQIQSQLSDRLQRSQFWTVAEQTAFINESLRTWSCLTGYWKKRVVINTLATLPYYNIAGYITFGMHVEFNGRPLLPSTVVNWDKGYPYWEGRPSVNGPDEWAPIGISMFAIRPTDAATGNTLLIDGVAAAPILADPIKDFIDIGDEELTSLLGYCQYLAAFKEGGAEFESAVDLYQAFLKAAAVKNEKLNASAIFRRAMGLDIEQGGQRQRRSKPEAQAVGNR